MQFDLNDRIKSFAYAGRGVYQMLRTQQNAWIHALATVLVLLLSAWIGLTAGEWCLIILTIALVWMAEAFNTALEILADVTSPHFNPLVGKAKDVAAGAVMISSIGAVVIATVIFLPYLIDR
ncbi:diacylglycerol kinase family protein [candidate division KSB1 bacterium]|nr:diacylglycerol kinase family protein [candidate division KSB1 bacterium]